MASSGKEFQLLESTLRNFGKEAGDIGPKPLFGKIKALANVNDIECSDKDIEFIRKNIISEDPNNHFRNLLGVYLRSWDFLANPDWADGSEPLTKERRKRIYSLLEFDEQTCGLCSKLNPISKRETHPITIARDHQEWYTPERRKIGDYYWSEFSKYLEEFGKWNESSIDALGEASTLVVERFSDPEREEVYPTKGLVVGYVQSGKTANFTAVTAKAVDAGYRLIIILAGTINILREQTQRRIDKELIGKEILETGGPDRDYLDDKDWDEFISHGGLPAELGHIGWTRLTGAKEDYQKLKHGIEALEAQSKHSDRRFNDPANLRSANARIIVMKKIPSVIKKLNQDLQRLTTRLEEVPALIIDDESDQASVNTVNPTKADIRKRTETNKQIIEMLRLLPRAQYVGYTATPFANVLIDPSDSEDLFPKDYIVSLPRPDGYMGIIDFFDFSEDGSDIPDEDMLKGYLSNERAYIRDVIGGDEEEIRDNNGNLTGNLPVAIRSFILSGAIKLFRKEKGVNISTKHHTMLVHRSTRIADHEEDAKLVMSLYDNLGVGNKQFYKEMEELWLKDYQPVSKVRSEGIINPGKFIELKPFIDICISNLEKGEPVRVVNGDKKFVNKLPNFERDNVWSVLVGGTKLSRGYTVEGLTISYYRRAIKTADTLMQVGRWFGFRKGYKDLVRVYLGRNENVSKTKTMDLKEAFKSICKDEESFRQELLKYTDKSVKPRILPIQIPPLISCHLPGQIQPTSTNKMWNAEVHYLNYSTKWREHVVPDSNINNVDLVSKILMKGGISGPIKLGYGDEEWSAYLNRINNSEMIDFLEKFRWINNDPIMYREIQFLKDEKIGDQGIDQWMVIFPQITTANKYKWDTGKKLSVFGRARTNERGSFKVFSEQRHRKVAEYLVGLEEIEQPTKDTQAERTERTGIMLCYPVFDNKKVQGGDDISKKDLIIGFGLKFPKNKIEKQVVFGVKDQANTEAATANK